MMSSGTSEQTPLLGRTDSAAAAPSSADENPASDPPVVSARTGVPLHKTVRAFLDSDNHEDNEIGITYIRKVLALLVLQYAAVLVIISPFCLLDLFKSKNVIPFLIPLAALSFFGLLYSSYLALMKGHIRLFARIALFTMTICFALALGAKLCLVPWSAYALIALGQATTNFALLLSIFQFDSRALHWLKAIGASLLCFVQSSMWVLILRELGVRWLVSTLVPLGGWLYAVNIIFAVRKSTYHREPHDYIQGTIFILGPSIPTFLIPKRRTASSRWVTVRAATRIVGVSHNTNAHSSEEKKKQEKASETKGDAGVDAAVVSSMEA